MIYVKLMGGLGNQLFQYATGRSLAIRMSTELVIDDSWYSVNKVGVTPRRFELDNFNIAVRKPGAFDLAIIKIGKLGVVRFIKLGVLFGYFKEKEVKFDADIFRVRGNIYIDGYWQSYKYFGSIYGQLKNELTCKKKIEAQDRFILESIEATNSVAVHVRRGDYVSSEGNSNIYGACTVDYYDRAFHYMCGKVDSPHFFIFSDDPGWARDNINPPGQRTYVSRGDDRSDIRDFVLMSNCKCQIIANSTFSWWAAYLNPSESKVVVAPERWYLNKEHSIEDIIPSGWVML